MMIVFSVENQLLAGSIIIFFFILILTIFMSRTLSNLRTMLQSKPGVHKKILMRAYLHALVLLLFTCSVSAQQLQLNYKVVQNGNNIGWLKLQKNDSSETSVIRFNSEVKKRFLFLFSMIEKQEVLFQNGLMIKSYVYRKVNEDVKINKLTIYKGDHYIVSEEKSLKSVMINNIRYNQLCLYFFEPINIRQIYSDNFECLLTVEKMKKDCYQIKLPDGNTNYYYYTNGICSKVKVEHNLFSVDFI